MIPKEKQAEIVKGARQAGAQEADNGFWKELEERMDIRDASKKVEVTPRRTKPK
jgi:hypothetical protein